MNITPCLAGIYNIFNEIIFVDNNSTDNTLYLGQKFKEEKDIQKKEESINIRLKSQNAGMNISKPQGTRFIAWYIFIIGVFLNAVSAMFLNGTQICF